SRRILVRRRTELVQLRREVIGGRSSGAGIRELLRERLRERLRVRLRRRAPTGRRKTPPARATPPRPGRWSPPAYRTRPPSLRLRPAPAAVGRRVGRRGASWA